MGDLARIAPTKTSITFLKETKKQLVSVLKATSDHAAYMRCYLLNDLHESVSMHYHNLYRNKLQHLGAIEQI